MGRRSYGISWSKIERLAAMSRAAERRDQRRELVNSNSDLEKIKEPTYSISNFNFNKSTRVCHVDFLESTMYRTISKYVTINGIRHPIFSDWKEKTKIVKKTLKLTNENLENLQNHDDNLISEYCYEIVANIDDEDYYPSWFINDTIYYEMNNKISKTKDHCEELIFNENIIINNYRKENEQLENKQKANKIKFKNLNENIQKVSNLLIKIENKKGIIFYSIITFGLYLLTRSKKRIENLKIKLKIYKNNLDTVIIESEENDKKIVENKEKIECCFENIDKYKENSKKEIKSIKDTYNEKLKSVEPLGTNIDLNHNGFIPLKKIQGFNYKRIMGCYIIKNTEKEKYYVGQSKDILKRICKQHFDYLKPKNIIFAEDFYTSNFENKDNLFEVKIIQLKTKDEMDLKEKELIEFYDAFNHGYNGTSGNS